MQTIYDAIGGHSALDAAVQRFYDRVTADPIISYFFEGMDLRKLKNHQIAFLAQALDGPARYNGRGMHLAHAHLRIEQRHFDAVARHLGDTLRDFAVPEALTSRIMDRLAALAPQIVNTPSFVAAGAD